MWRVEDGRIVEHGGGLGAGGQLHRALTVEGANASPESLVGKTSSNDEMELESDDLVDG
jgi:hypothetical protein